MRFSNTLFLVSLLLPVACQKGQSAPADLQALEKLRSEGDLFIAKKIKEEIPLDPFSPAWGQGEEVPIELVSQISIVPRSPKIQRTPLSVRSLYNKKEVGFLLKWRDRTKDDGESRAERFRDAFALAFPMNYGDGSPLPYIGMGSKGRPVNIWHWKASWQSDIDEGFAGVEKGNPGMVPNSAPLSFNAGQEAGSPLSRRERKSSVENLLAEGFGTLTSVATATPAGRGIWKDGEWHLVVKKSLKGEESEVPIDLKKGLLPVTFAVWDGSAGERNGIKGLTRWRFLRFEGESIPANAIQGLLTGKLGDRAAGERLVSEAGCVMCHNLPTDTVVKQARSAVEGEARSGFAGRGGDASPYNDVGPDLTLAGAIHRPEYLMESINNPSAVLVPVPSYFDPATGISTMPSYEGTFTDEDLNNMVEYLRGLR